MFLFLKSSALGAECGLDTRPLAVNLHRNVESRLHWRCTRKRKESRGRFRCQHNIARSQAENMSI